MAVWKSITCLCFFLLFCSTIAFTQNITISGTVTDKEGEPVPGVTVLVKGSLIGTVTDTNGKYTITVPSRDVVLQFSFIGYTTHEQMVENLTTINVTLSEESQLIDEVVVVAYGIQRKATLTGALSTVGTEDILRTPLPNVGNTLVGKLPGLSAIQYSGQPGADDPTIFVRGIGSLDAGRSAPLIMVDGVERSFFQLDPHEIESVSILKDASATAVFGVRGANGVILVTTRRGQIGKPRISVSTSAGFQKPVLAWKFANSYEFATMYNAQNLNDGTHPDDLTFTPYVLERFRLRDDLLLYPDTDWMGMFLKPAALQTQHNINISGGTDKVRYFTSFGALTQDGLYRSFVTEFSKFTYSRYNYRANLDIDVTSTTLLKINLGGRISDRNNPNSTQGGFMEAILYGMPFGGAGFYEGKHIKAHSDNVKYVLIGGSDPFESLYMRGFSKLISNTVNLDLALTQKLDFITPGLSFTAKGSYNNAFTHTKNRSKEEPNYTAHRNAAGELYIVRQNDGIPVLNFSESIDGRNRTWQLQGSMNYTRSYKKHNVSALALYNQWRDAFPGGNYAGIPRGLVELAGRVTYDFNTKYLLDFNVGYNGSENFHRDHRYGLFPAISGGWIITQENFMKGIPFLEYVKMRASYGIVGNDRYGGASDRFFYLPDGYSPSSGGYSFGTTVPTAQPIATELRIGNKLVSWETSRKQNYGVDLTLWGARIAGTVEYWIENRSGILITRNTDPTHIALSMPVVNLGETLNKGFEVVLKWNHKIGNFKYNIGGNASYARNKRIFIDEIPRAYPWLYNTGRPVGQQRGLVFEGFATEELIASGELPKHSIDLKPGDAFYKDQNGDGIINDNDVMPIGYPSYPEVTGGFNLGFAYKNFDFSMMWIGVTRVSRYMSGVFRIPFDNANNRGIMKHMYDNYWTPERAEAGTALAPRPSLVSKSNNYSTNSTLWLYDASYLRMKNVHVGYNMRGNWLKSIGISNLRLYATGENLLTFTRMKYTDPEQTDGARVAYPLLVVFNFGLNINF